VIENSPGFVRACASTIETPPRRSPGSLLKPFVYLRALEKRCLTAATPLDDDPAAPPFPDYQPRNYDARAHGRPTVRQALACSLNRPAMRVLAAAGPRECFQRLARWGFAAREGFDARGAGFVLGNFDASPIEVAAAYSALARGGEAWAPRWTGSPPSEIRQAGEPAACALVADILADPAARRPSFGSGSPLDLPFRAAVKTGTSSSFRDGWCAGFDADHTVVVWRGHASGTPLGERLAVQTAAPIWNRMMRFLAGRGSRPLPALVESKALQQHSLPGTGQPEWFLAGTGPPPASPPPAAPQILFPREGMLVELTPGLSPSRQKIIPRSEPPAARWLLNGQPVSEEGIALEPGSHRLTAEFPGGIAAVSFRVEAPQ
ncbi:MAG: penicillin-binding transpeptidase domain-containing protein, partial [Terrimicrobiaceae bacterium]|nr:penicillin-binding transpeptidase domain-containing protein [Terrimicrobiaceae bacterium]